MDAKMIKSNKRRRETPSVQPSNTMSIADKEGLKAFDLAASAIKRNEKKRELHYASLLLNMGGKPTREMHPQYRSRRRRLPPPLREHPSSKQDTELPDQNSAETEDLAIRVHNEVQKERELHQHKASLHQTSPPSLQQQVVAQPVATLQQTAIRPLQNPSLLQQASHHRAIFQQQRDRLQMQQQQTFLQQRPPTNAQYVHMQPLKPPPRANTTATPMIHTGAPAAHTPPLEPIHAKDLVPVLVKLLSENRRLMNNEQQYRTIMQGFMNQQQQQRQA